MSEITAMTGVDAATGKHLTGTAHLQQSMRDILTTPIGSRIHRRDYGSRIHELIDKPLNAATVTQIYAAVVEALEKWEPRLRVASVSVESVTPAQLTLKIVGYYRHNGEEVSLDGIVINV